MKWFNKNKTRMLNLDMISSFLTDEFDDVFSLEIVIEGRSVYFFGEEAIEIYNLLTNKNYD